MPSDPSAHLLVIADHLERCHHEVGDLVPTYLADEREDLAGALVEAERALRTATRLVRRAARLTGH